MKITLKAEMDCGEVEEKKAMIIFLFSSFSISLKLQP